jgi:hypothetical protein
VEAHISLATVYYRLQRKADGDREKALAEADHGAENEVLEK